MFRYRTRLRRTAGGWTGGEGGVEMKRHAGAFALQSDTAARRHCGFLLAQRDRVGFGFAIQAEQNLPGTQAGLVGRAARSEDGRVGKECVSSCLSWWSPDT